MISRRGAMQGKGTAVAIVILVAVAGFTAYFLLNQGGGRTQTSSSVTTCWPWGLPGQTGVFRSQLQSVQFGAVKEYVLPGPARWPNAITAAPDGSVWFGEESVPGVGHLLANGTLVEYPWPTATWTSSVGCGYRTGIWGVSVWGGMVWATDQDENAVVGLNPATGGTTVVNVTGKAPSPYTLSPAPDGSLWFTSLSTSARLGRIAPDLSLSVYPVNGLNGEVPIQVQFVNSTLAYFVAINESANPYTPYGHLYSFNPQAAAGGVDPVKVRGAFQILQPTSVSASDGLVWMTQHGASSLVMYETGTGAWTVFPTTTVNFTSTTLPYFVEATPAGAWFNEHYANRIAFLNESAGTLTEYSEANPPVENGSLIQNDLTIALGDGGLWFTSTTGDYIGFVDGSYRNAFSFKVDGGKSATVAVGASATFRVEVNGNWSKPLQVVVSDSEAYDSKPKLMQVVPSAQAVPAGGGPHYIDVDITALSGLKPGGYTVALGVSDGLVIQTVYLFLTVP